MFTVWNIHRDEIHALFFLLEVTQMTTDTTREFSLAVAAMIGLSTAMLVTPVAVAADKAANKATGTYVTGDFHNHTTCSDGSLSLRKLVDKSAGTFGLDWFVQAGHGGSSTRNCTLSEDPFEPVPAALGLTIKIVGIIAKYLAMSLEIDKVVSAPRVISSCLPIATKSINLVGS